MNTDEFEDRLEALRPRFHRYCAHDGIGGLLAEPRLRPNIVEAALVINLLQTPVCVFRSKLKGVFGLPAVHRPRRPEPLWRLCRRQTDAVVHGHSANTVKENEYAEPDGKRVVITGGS
jgi:hypothetical protein